MTPISAHFLTFSIKLPPNEFCCLKLWLRENSRSREMQKVKGRKSYSKSQNYQAKILHKKTHKFTTIAMNFVEGQLITVSRNHSTRPLNVHLFWKRQSLFNMSELTSVMRGRGWCRAGRGVMREGGRRTLYSLCITLLLLIDCWQCGPLSRKKHLSDLKTENIFFRYWTKPPPSKYKSLHIKSQGLYFASIRGLGITLHAPT